MAGKRQSRLCRAATGKARRHPALLDMPRDRLDKRRLTAKKMLAPRDIDGDGIGKARHDMRREAGARTREQIEPVPIRRSIGLDRDQAGDAHPRIGKRHSRGKPLALRTRIHRRQSQRILLPGDKHKRCIGRCIGRRVRRRAGRGAPVRLLLPQAIRGEIRKPERQRPSR